VLQSSSVPSTTKKRKLRNLNDSKYGGNFVCMCEKVRETTTQDGYCETCNSKIHWKCYCEKNLAPSGRQNHCPKCEKWLDWDKKRQSELAASKLAKREEDPKLPFTTPQNIPLIGTLDFYQHESTPFSAILEQNQQQWNSIKEELKEFTSKHNNALQVLLEKCNTLESCYNNELENPLLEKLDAILSKLDSVTPDTRSDGLDVKSFTTEFIEQLDTLRTTSSALVTEREVLINDAAELLTMKKSSKEFKEKLEEWKTKLKLNKIKLDYDLK